MKVLHVVQTSLPNLAGYTVRTKYIVENQLLKGLCPVVITSPFHPAESIYSKGSFDEIDGVKYYRTNCINNIRKNDFTATRYLKKIIISKRYIAEIVRVCNQEKPDIIHAHSDYLNGISAAKVGSMFGIPVLYEVRGLWSDAAVANDGLSENSWKYRYGYRMNRKAMSLADHVCCLGTVLRDELLRMGVDGNKLSVVHNAVDIKSFSLVKRDHELMRQYKLVGGKVLGFIGSVRKLEGLDMLIEAMPEILRKFPETKALIVGGGDKELGRLKLIAKNIGIEDSVVFVGNVPHSHISQYYSIIDIMVYPRINKKINQKVTPLKPLETMVMGNVILASDVGGLAELIDDGRTGILFKSEDRADFVDKCCMLLSERTLRDRLIKESGAWVKENRAWEKIVDDYLSLYKEIS